MTRLSSLTLTISTRTSTAKKVKEAARVILKSREGLNPYPIAYHSDGCEENIWDLDSPTLLISPQEFKARRCGACEYEWNLWSGILHLTAERDPDNPKVERRDPIHGDLALRGLAIEVKVTDFHYPIKKLSGFDWDLLQLVHTARQEYESHRAWKANEEAKSK